MLTIICGEDVVSSRNFLLSLQSDYQNKAVEIRHLEPEDLFEIDRWLADSPTLFSEKKIFFTQFLNKKIKKDNKRILDELAKIGRRKDVDLVDWEDSSSRELKMGKIATIKEFKPDKNIFKLLDGLYPGNRLQFLLLLEQLSANLDENFIFLMVARHLRNLILAKHGTVPPRMQSWQFGKLKYQARSWKVENLVSYYEGLLRIDVATKTGRSPYSVKESLDILSCYYL